MVRPFKAARHYAWPHACDVGFAEDQPVVGARYRYLTSRDKNKLSATQAQACIAAAILRQLHAIMVTGQKWDPVIAAGGRPTAEPTLVAA